MNRYPINNTQNVQLTSSKASRAAADLNETKVLFHADLMGGIDVERDGGIWLKRVTDVIEKLEAAHAAAIKAASLAAELQQAFFAEYPH